MLFCLRGDEEKLKKHPDMFSATYTKADTRQRMPTANEWQETYMHLQEKNVNKGSPY